MVELLLSAADLLPCIADACVGCLCCTGCLCCAGKAALTVIRDIQARRPCAKGLTCTSVDPGHLRKYSHPDDDDYGYCIRMHSGKGQFSTLRQCFNFMDPHQLGYVRERAALQELLQHLGTAAGRQRRWGGRGDKELEKLWQVIDTDGNKYISFPEFVEWATRASMTNPELCLPQSIGIVGEKGRTGQYCLRCTVPGCGCENFCAAVEGDRFCAHCPHKRGQHAGSPRDLILAVLPPDWASRVEAFDAESVSGQFRLVPCGPEGVAQMQRMVDASVRRVWTRDRGKENKVPSGYQVVKVERNENVRLWLKYVLKKTLMVEALDDQELSGKLPPLLPYEMLTSECARTLPLLEGYRLEERVNEWFLWHGASSAGIKSIAEQEFKQLHAGSNTGTLYGAGTYLSDSCTKADEYARESTDGEDEGLCCALLCRVMGGRVRYTDVNVPNGEVLVKEVLEGPYDCVFGDRQKCRGTFKEIVVYESNQAYPEYLVYYRRLYEAEP